MKKVKGKALSLVLSLALVISSFSMLPVSAATKTLPGELSGSGTDTFYFVNGENTTDPQKPTLDVDDSFGTEVTGSYELSTERHKPADNLKIDAISHKSGDRLVKVYDNSDGKEDNIDKDTEISNIALRLRNASVSGTEVLSVLYSGTWTDDDDKEYTVKQSVDVTVRVYDKGEVVIGKSGTVTGKGEFDGTFAQKTVSGKADVAHLTALEATKENGKLAVKWESLKTDKYDKNEDTSAADYVLKSGSDNLVVTNGATDATTTYTLTGGEVPADNAGTTTYDVTGGAPADGDSPAVAEGSDGKLTVTKAVSDTGDDWTYNYKLNADKAASTDDAVTAGTTDAISLAPDTTKAAVTAFDSTGTEKGTTVVTVTATTTGVVDGKNFASFTQGTGDKANTLTVAKAANDNVEATPWTYTYAINAGAATAIKDGETFTVPATDGTYSISVIAKDAANKTYETKGSVVVATKASAATDDVTVSVKNNAGIGSVTLTAYATKTLKDKIDAKTSDVSSKSNVSQKTKVEKKVLVDDPAFTKIGKYGTNTYVYSGSLDKDSVKDATKTTKVNGYDVSFQNSATVTVADKASVTKISGKIAKISIDESSVSEIALADGAATEITVSDAKVGDIDYGDQNGSLTVDSPKADVGNVKDATAVTVTGGKVGNIASKDVTITPDDDDYAVTVGDISASGLVTIDSGDSKGVTTGTITATGDDSEFDISGENDTIKGFDFDYYGAELKLDGFSGSIPAPKKADTLVDGASISTQQSGDKVTVTGDADISAVSIADESQIAFDSSVNVGSVDGSGTLIVGAGKLNVVSDASDVKLKLADASFKIGDVAYTSTHDTIDTDSFENYGFTVTKSESSSKDTFKIASVEFTGLAFAKSTVDIANGYSETFQATPYAPGTQIPDGYHIQYTLDGTDTIFEGVENENGTYTVNVKGYDTTFPSENKATLTAELVDTDGATNDEYSAAEVDLTALAVPTATYKSDTGSTLSIGGGFTYQFAVTSLNNVEPYFVVAGSSFQATKVGNSGNTYYYKVKAVGKVGDAAGVYINHEAKPSTVITITNPCDTAAVTVNAGNSYQFRVTGPSQPVFQVAGIGNIPLTSKDGSNYFFKVKVPTNLAKGGHGVYSNGVRVAVLTVA